MYYVPVLITAFFLGFNSGVNYASIGSSLTIFLNDIGLSVALIGFLSLRLIPFSFKALWTPVVDLVAVRTVGIRIGMRKDWIAILQLLLAFCYVILSLIMKTQNFSEENYSVILFTTVFMAFLGATSDSVLHGYRIELFKNDHIHKGSMIIAFSFSVGFLFSTSVALLLSSRVGWSITYLIYSLLILPGIIAIWLSRDDKSKVEKLTIKKIINKLKRNYFIPFLGILKKPYAKSVIIIAMFFKVSDSFMSTLLVPYLLDCGFTKDQIFGGNKFVEFFSISIGIFFAGYFLKKGKNIIKLIFSIEILAALSNLFFISLIYIPNTFLLGALSFFEAIISSTCNLVLMTFLSYFAKSSLRFTATIYAVLESCSLLNRYIISSFGGKIVEISDWKIFLIVSSALSVPTIITSIYLIRSKNFMKAMKISNDRN